jgi:hypothetical protein
VRTRRATKTPQNARRIDIDPVSIIYDSARSMARGDDTPDGAWFVAARLADRPPHGPGAVDSCRVCGAEVWVEADDAGLAQSCAAVACAECASTTPGVIYIPSGPLAGEATANGHGAEAPSALRDEAALPRCGGCGQPVAVDEPAWIEEPDGAVHPSSQRNFDAADRSHAWRIWHLACFSTGPDDNRR